jgi:uncharacterized damage-inducible protein DinB
MNPEQTAFLLHYLATSCESEVATTRKVLAAVPEDNTGYKLDEKSRTAIEQVNHIVKSEQWFLKSIVAGEFSPEDEKVAEGATIASLVAEYDATVPALWAQVKALDHEQLSKPLNFFGIFNFPAVAYLTFHSNHTIHHRGQLAAALRPMGSKVPSIYGGSADEPFQMPAGA